MHHILWAALLAFGVLAQSASAAITGLERIASGLNAPVYTTHAPGDASRLFVVEQAGVIRILDLGSGQLLATPFLTVPETETGSEAGLLGLAFHPDYGQNGRFFVYVTIDNGGQPIDGGDSPFSSHVREYRVSMADPNVADPDAVEILSWLQPRGNHNAGWIGFNPKLGASDPQYLYVMSGDGGGTGDPHNHAQTLGADLLGKVLRVDIDGDDFPSDSDRNYAIPETNPFGSEIWAYGLRNPWRASFDRETGDLWLGDVGQNAVEEIDYQPVSSTGGENYAWNRREGRSAYAGGSSLPGDVEPVYDYPHGSGSFEGDSVVGGLVYRGPDPDLRGRYFFADTISANLWSFDPADPFGTVERINDVLVPDQGSLGDPVSFGEDAAGHLYLVDYGNGGIAQGEVFRIAVPESDATLLTLAAVAALLGLSAWRSAIEIR